MESLIEASFEKDFENNDCEYFFTLLDARFDYLNYLWVEELEKKFDVFPGQVKITIIREFRAEATTKI